MTFWIYLNQELSDLRPNFEVLFGVNNLYRDYENVWEWLGSSNYLASYQLNISRSHSGSQGNYDQPIIIRISSNSGVALEEATLAQMIKDHFSCDVYGGEISIGENEEIVIGAFRAY